MYTFGEAIVLYNVYLMLTKTIIHQHIFKHKIQEPMFL